MDEFQVWRQEQKRAEQMARTVQAPATSAPTVQDSVVVPGLQALLVGASSSTSSSKRRHAAAAPRPYGGSREQVLRRLARMEGQVRGVARMIEREDDCVDVLQQTAALRAAVDSVTMLLMEDHVQGCVSTAAQGGDADALTTEVMDVVRRGMGRPARSSSRGSSDT